LVLRLFPALEVLGYFRLSLRDKDRDRIRRAACSTPRATLTR